MIAPKRSACVAALVLAFVMCGTGAAVFILSPRLDRAVCLPRVANRIGVQPSYPAIYGYIRELITVGMTRDEALAVLEKIGPMHVAFSTKLPYEDTMRDQVHLNICWHPVNQIILHLYYSSTDERISDVIIDED